MGRAQGRQPSRILVLRGSAGHLADPIELLLLYSTDRCRPVTDTHCFRSSRTSFRRVDWGPSKLSGKLRYVLARKLAFIEEGIALVFRAGLLLRVRRCHSSRRKQKLGQGDLSAVLVADFGLVRYGLRYATGAPVRLRGHSVRLVGIRHTGERRLRGPVECIQRPDTIDVHLWVPVKRLGQRGFVGAQHDGRLQCPGLATTTVRERLAVQLDRKPSAAVLDLDLQLASPDDGHAAIAVDRRLLQS